MKPSFTFSFLNFTNFASKVVNSLISQSPITYRMQEFPVPCWIVGGILLMWVARQRH